MGKNREIWMINWRKLWGKMLLQQLILKNYEKGENPKYNIIWTKISRKIAKRKYVTMQN